LGTEMKKTGMIEVNTFRVANLPKAKGSSSIEASSPQNSPSLSTQERGPVDSFNVASRRCSLPVVLENFPNLQIPSNQMINLPPPIRRHSMDSLLSSGSTIQMSTSFQNSTLDFSQELPAFNLPPIGSQTVPNRLACVEPPLGNVGIANVLDKNMFPDWFVAEKKRILGIN